MYLCSLINECVQALDAVLQKAKCGVLPVLRSASAPRKQVCFPVRIAQAILEA